MADLHSTNSSPTIAETTRSAFAKIIKSRAYQSKSSAEACNKYDVFINHYGKDAKKTVASLIYYNLRNRKLKVFLDNKAMVYGANIPVILEEVVRNASVHVAVFSRNYAESAWCLIELCLMMESGAPIIPIFYGVRPSDLRMGNAEGVYSKAFQKHLLARTVDVETAEEWRNALRSVSYNYGFEFRGDHGMMLEEIASCVVKHVSAASRLVLPTVCIVVCFVGAPFLLTVLYRKVWYIGYL